MKDYTIEDFKKQPEDKRLEDLSRINNHIIRMLTILSLKRRKIYKNGEEIRNDFLEFIGKNLDDIIDNNVKVKDIIPGSTTYFKYLSTINEKEGILTKIGIIIEVDKNRYIKSSFGEDIEGFLNYLLKEYVKFNINPYELFGHTRKSVEKANPVNTINVIEYLVENKDKKIGMKDIEDTYKLSESIVRLILFRLSKLGLIIYNKNRQPIIIYKVNLDKAKEYYNKLYENPEEEMKKYKISNYSIENIEYILNYIIKNEKSILDPGELINKRGMSLVIINKYISILSKEDVINKEKINKSYIQINNELVNIYNEIILPIKEISKNPDKIKDYKIYENKLTKDDITKLLVIYYKWKKDLQEKEDKIIDILNKNKCLTLSEISKYTKYNTGTLSYTLKRLEKMGIVKRDDNKWCYDE
ncbi:hypothetical protein YN1_7680 [Nanoarchaeota archaeon]